MAIAYPCQVGLPEDLHPTIKALIFLCSDFHIITQDHNGKTDLEKLHLADSLAVWAAVVDRADVRFEVFVLEHEDWLEFRVRLFANGSTKFFLQIIFRQPRKSNVPDCGWSFTSLEETDETLRVWVGRVWPTIHNERIDVLRLRELVPREQRLLADSSFMFDRLNELLGWYSQLRVQ